MPPQDKRHTVMTEQGVSATWWYSNANVLLTCYTAKGVQGKRALGGGGGSHINPGFKKYAAITGKNHVGQAEGMKGAQWCVESPLLSNENKEPVRCKCATQQGPKRRIPMAFSLLNWLNENLQNNQTKHQFVFQITGTCGWGWMSAVALLGLILSHHNVGWEDAQIKDNPHRPVPSQWIVVNPMGPLPVRNGYTSTARICHKSSRKKLANI